LTEVSVYGLKVSFFSKLYIYDSSGTTLTGLVSLHSEEMSVVWTPRLGACHIYIATTSCTSISIYIASYFWL